VGLRERALGRGSRGQAPEADSFLSIWASKGDGKFANFSAIPRRGKERIIV